MISQASTRIWYNLFCRVTNDVLTWLMLPAILLSTIS